MIVFAFGERGEGERRRERRDLRPDLLLLPPLFQSQASVKQ